jgi:hypothetical protein
LPVTSCVVQDVQLDEAVEEVPGDRVVGHVVLQSDAGLQFRNTAASLRKDRTRRRPDR